MTTDTTVDIGPFADVEDAPIATRDPFAATVFRSMQEVEAHWRTLEPGADMTPYQRFDFINAWAETLAPEIAVDPLVIELNDAHGTAAIWPLGLKRLGPLRTAVYLGGKHANYNMPLVRQDLADRATVGNALVKAVHDTGLVDVLRLHNQPETWRGRPHPLFHKGHQASASFAYSTKLGGTGTQTLKALRSGSTLRKLGRSERRVGEEFGEVVLRRLQPGDDPTPLIDAFIRQKAARMIDLGLPNLFSSPSSGDFLHRLATKTNADPAVEIYWLDIGGDIAATWWGIVSQGRFSAMINSHDADRYERYPIGDMLLRHMISDLADRGITRFDLGVGEATYKDRWCRDTDRLFETVLPLSAAGTLAAPPLRGWQVVKRHLKKSPRMMRIITAVRGGVHA